MVLWKFALIWQQIWKIQQGPQDWKTQFSFQSPGKAKNVKECRRTLKLPHNCIHLKCWQIMLKILQVGLNNTWTEIFQIFKLVLEKAEGQRSNCQHLLDHQKSKRDPEKKSISALLTMPKPLTVWVTINCGKFWKRWEYQTTCPVPWEICMKVRKQQLELGMEHTGSK